ncbi:MAG: ABC transporter permease subunit [Candidatus Dormiibacterota bacterium]
MTARAPASAPSGTATLVRYGLRAHRWTATFMAGLGFFAPASTGATFVAAAGATAAARAAFGRQTTALGGQLAYLVPLPLNPSTPAGYIWWKGLAFLPLVLGAWGLAAGTGAIRNEEERGLMENWLATPITRWRLVLARSGSFATVAAAVVLVTGLGTLVGVTAAGAPTNPTGLLEQGAALLGFTLVCWGLGLAAAQLASTRRSAIGLGALVLLGLYVLDVAARVDPAFSTWALASPLRLVDLTTAIVPGGRFDAAATAALFGIAAVLLALTGAAFSARDLGSPLFRRRPRQVASGRQPSGSRWERVPVVRSLWEQRVGLSAWLLGTAVGAALMTSLARSAGSALVANPSFRSYLRASGTSQATLAAVSQFWFGIAAVVVAAYAVTQTSRWASEDGNGRLEMELAQPMPRWRVVAERAAALLVGASGIAAVGGLGVGVTAPSQGLNLDLPRLVVASALLVPLGLTFGALGALIIAWAPRLAVPVLGLVAVVSFYVPILSPLLRWPSWTPYLSLLHLYGTPLTTGVDWAGLIAMVGIVAMGFVGAAGAMRLREVGS